MTLKTRVMPTLLYRENTLVKGVGFYSWRPVGSPQEAIRVYNLRGVDELMFLDITASIERRPPDFNLVDDFCNQAGNRVSLQTAETVFHLFVFVK